jgi:hypothetical protein
MAGNLKLADVPGVLHQPFAKDRTVLVSFEATEPTVEDF